VAAIILLSFEIGATVAVWASEAWPLVDPGPVPSTNTTAGSQLKPTADLRGILHGAGGANKPGVA